MGYGAPGGPYWIYPKYRASLGNPLLLEDLLTRHPKLRLYVMHAGMPLTDEMIAVATKHPNVYIDTSAYTVRRYPPALVDYVRTNGRRKVLFGTNWPMIAPRKALEGFDELELGAETADAFLAGNARRVFALDATAQAKC